MTTSGSSSITATATAAACGRRRLTRAAVVPSSSSSSSSQAGYSRQQQPASSGVPQSLFASLATLATAATASPTFAAKSSSSSSSHHHSSSYHHSLHLHHHHHHHPYHPYPKPSGSSTNNSSHGSGDETENDERADFQAEFNFPHQQLQVQAQQQQLQQQPRQQLKPQFHPQHHHRLITPVRQHRVSTNINHHSHNSMPRRKETKKIQINVPSSEASSGIEGDPHQVFKCNGSPIISPRSIRNSLAETDFDLDGNPRPQKIANTQIPNGTINSKSSSISNGTSHTAGMIGPVLPPSDVASPASTSSNGKKKNSRRQKQQQQQPQEDADTETVNGNGSTQNEMDLLALKVEEQSLSGMTGVQLWVHRLLYTHHQTLHVLGLERADFPNTRLSMKQLECMLSPVISLANMMTPDHFGIHVPTPQVAQTMNDVHYWKLWESDTIDIGIFFMPPNAHIPLHNHPGMSVVTRILYGSVNIRSYDLVSPQELGEDTEEVVSESTEIVGSDPKVKWARVSREGAYASESTMWLDPRRFNLHQIHAASDNGCALLDIMVPPYNNADRDCHHFKIIEERYNKDKNERIVKMVESITADNHNEPTETAPPPPPSAPSSPSQSESQSS